VTSISDASRLARVAALLDGRTLEHRHGTLVHDHDLGYLTHRHHDGPKEGRAITAWKESR